MGNCIISKHYTEIKFPVADLTKVLWDASSVGEWQMWNYTATEICTVYGRFCGRNNMTGWTAPKLNGVDWLGSYTQNTLYIFNMKKGDILNGATATAYTVIYGVTYEN